MIIKKVDIWHLNLAFKAPVKHNLATHYGSENIVVKLTTDAGVTGYGEGIPRRFVTGEILAESLAFLKKVLIPEICRLPLLFRPSIYANLARVGQQLGAANYPAIWCAVEMAWLDAASKTCGQPLAEILGFQSQRAAIYSAVLPMASEQQMARFFELVKLKKMRFLKLKVGTSTDPELLKSVRQQLGWEIDIRVDANAAWSPPEAMARIEAMAPYRLSAVEQPVAKEDFEGLQRVSAAVAIPIIADESVCTEEDARRLIEMRACQIFNLRLSKCGGLLSTMRIKKMAEKAGIKCQLGCHVGETSILAAAGRHFALTTDHLAYVEGSFAPYLLAKDVVRQPVFFENGGLARALPGPGLGIQVEDHILEELAVSRDTID
ncbi:MAG: hypothetical protein BZ151_03925 [Desulfobacca sp. 4484_104]|nr:MAG: hypothetical protein BZ151_03925 [Desulfobacca sp. 4484_104]